MVKMHTDEADIDVGLVRHLLRGQFPGWAGLPVERLASGGTVNAVYRLGDTLSVRLPLMAGGAEDLAREARWLPRLAPVLPVAIPAVVAIGRPAEGYPWAWAVHRWIDGDLRNVSLDDGPRAYRGVPLATVDAQTRTAIETLSRIGEPFDADQTTAVWDDALAAAPWTKSPCWVHSDLMPSNLLVNGGRLTGVIDFATIGVGDPACDLVPAWNLLPAPAREIFRDATGSDEATWARGRGWALSMALIQLPYYRDTNPVISANARHVLREVLTG